MGGWGKVALRTPSPNETIHDLKSGQNIAWVWDSDEQNERLCGAIASYTWRCIHVIWLVGSCTQKTREKESEGERLKEEEEESETKR